MTAAEGDFDRSKVTFTNGVTLSADGKSVIVPAGVSSFTVTVPTINDTVDEADETLKLAVGGKDATGTIVDNDDAPTISGVSVSNTGAKADEGSALNFKVDLSAASRTSHQPQLKPGRRDRRRRRLRPQQSNGHQWRDDEHRRQERDRAGPSAA